MVYNKVSLNIQRPDDRYLTRSACPILVDKWNYREIAEGLVI